MTRHYLGRQLLYAGPVLTECRVDRFGDVMDHPARRKKAAEASEAAELAEAAKPDEK